MNRKDEAKQQTGGEKEGTARKRVKTFDPVDTGTQEFLSSQGAGVGVQRPDINDSGAGRWGDRGESYHRYINATLGEVLEHLANLESRFYDYVHAHQERLDTRRQESQSAEQEFQQEAQQLKDKIFSLLEQRENEISSASEEPE